VRTVGALLRERLHEIIFEADTPAGKAFDVALLVAIVVSVLAVMLETVESIEAEHGMALRTIEWVLTVVFTAEYLLRLYASWQPARYAVSFFGIVDLLAVLPTWLSLFFVGSQSMAVVRVFRLVRVFRVLKLARFLSEARSLSRALRASLPKITVFLVVVLSLVVIVGAAMYLIEGREHGFTSIPRSMYWAIVTVTTVGYGDLAPTTTVGQVLASLLMISGYAIIAVPTGIVAAEMTRRSSPQESTQVCKQCLAEGHPEGAVHCYRCGARL